MSDPNLDIVDLLHQIDKKLDLITEKSENHEDLDTERFAAIGRTIQLLAGGGAAFATILAGILVAVITAM